MPPNPKAMARPWIAITMMRSSISFETASKVSDAVAPTGEAAAFLHMSRGDIADYLGLTTETVSRIFSMLKRDGSIQLFELGGVRLLKPEKIEAMAGH